MKVMCAHCAKEGKPALIRETEPLDDPMITHGICAEHRRLLYQEIEGMRKQMAAPGSRQYGRLSVALPVIGWAPQFQGTALPGMVRYLSEGGLMVEFPVELMRGTRVRVALPTVQGSLEVAGNIVWTVPHGRVIRHGLAFPEPEGPDFIPRVVGEKR